jgi:hypothetical protein
LPTSGGLSLQPARRSVPCQWIVRGSPEYPRRSLHDESDRGLGALSRNRGRARPIAGPRSKLLKGSRANGARPRFQRPGSPCHIHAATLACRLLVHNNVHNWTSRPRGGRLAWADMTGHRLPARKSVLWTRRVRLEHGADLRRVAWGELPGEGRCVPSQEVCRAVAEVALQPLTSANADPCSPQLAGPHVPLPRRSARRFRRAHGPDSAPSPNLAPPRCVVGLSLDWSLDRVMGDPILAPVSQREDPA